MFRFDLCQNDTKHHHFYKLATNYGEYWVKSCRFKKIKFSFEKNTKNMKAYVESLSLPSDCLFATPADGDVAEWSKALPC